MQIPKGFVQFSDGDNRIILKASSISSFYSFHNGPYGHRAFNVRADGYVFTVDQSLEEIAFRIAEASK